MKLNSKTNSTSQLLPTISSLIQNPIPQSQYPNLENIIKLLNQHMNLCVKNREYIQAQKAKDKIEEAYACIKSRNAGYITDRRLANMKRLQAKHQEDRQLMRHEWDMKVNSVQQKCNEQIQKKKRSNEQQIARLREQVQLALPHSFSPDQKLKSLRYEQKHLASQGHFIEAQKIKDEIQSRQLALEQKHRKLREANIRSMIQQLEQKHEKDIKQQLKQKKLLIDELIRERNKKLKELEQRQNKEMREMKWMHDEELRMMMN